MKQFIDKLISRLEEEKGKDICDSTLCSDCRQKYKTNSKDDCYKPIQMLVYENTISIVNQLAEEYKGGWIPCSEQKPEGDQNVLTCDDRGNLHVFCFDGYRKCFVDDYYRSIRENHPQFYVPIAWMPLPEPYRKSEEDKQVSTERPQVIHEGFNDHDCEVRYRCPCCNKPFGSWGVKKNENGNNCCPHCDVELDGIGV